LSTDPGPFPTRGGKGCTTVESTGTHPRAALLTAVFLLGLVTAVLTPTMAGADQVAGTAVITHPFGSSPLDAGGSATEYGVALPSGAKCPGDTAHKGYRVYSYLVPKGVSLETVGFTGAFPQKYYGYVAEGSFYGATNTDEDSGLIPTLPPEFTFARLTPSELFANGEKSAVWDGGFACATEQGQVTNYWNSDIQFIASSSDPGGFTWRVLHPPSGSIDLGLWISVALIVVAVGSGTVALVLSRRQRGHTVPAVTEDVVIGSPTVGAEQ
jgi:hypothetical protein